MGRPAMVGFGRAAAADPRAGRSGGGGRAHGGAPAGSGDHGLHELHHRDEADGARDYRGADLARPVLRRARGSGAVGMNEAKLRPVTLDDIEALAIGAWILGTGGGGSPYLGLLNMRRLHAEGHRGELMSPFDLPDEDRGAVRSNIGAPLVRPERPPRRPNPPRAGA